MIYTLKLLFGADQQLAIDALIEETKKEGRIIDCKNFPTDKEMIGWEIEFRSLYDVYIFGHRSAHLFERLMGILSNKV